MREIKFRTWDEKRKCFEHWGIGDIDGDGAGCKFPSLTQTKLPQMQYTGLLDKNGVEIYEGDIVQWSSFSIPLIVKFSDGAFKIKCWDIGKRSKKSLEVIGNIYENPELLAK